MTSGRGPARPQCPLPPDGVRRLAKGGDKLAVSRDRAALRDRLLAWRRGSLSESATQSLPAPQLVVPFNNPIGVGQQDAPTWTGGGVNGVL